MNREERVEINRALAKVIAFRDQGKFEEAEEWTRTLVQLLGCAGILLPGSLISEGVPR